MAWSITLGRIAGTAVRIHVTFLLLLAWIGFSAWRSGGAEAAVAGVAFMVLLFACVLAHEFGHIAMARRFGVATPDVTLLPIGGVATLDQMPESPRAQLLVALAGPAVNVVIAAVLIAGLGLFATPSDIAAAFDKVEHPDIGLVARLAAANIMLVLFNLTPAFPMDGGRVLNALLAMRMDKTRALRIAARAGQVMAFVFGFVGLAAGNPLLMLVAVFIFVAAAAEEQASGFEAAAAGLRVADAMETRFAAIPIDATLDDAADILLATPQHAFPVVDAFHKPVGVLARDALIEALRRVGSAAPVFEALDAGPPAALRAADALEMGVGEMNRLGVRSMCVVDESGALVGLLTLDNLGELLLLRAARPERSFRRAG